MRVLIIGHCFIARHLAKQLASGPHEVCIYNDAPHELTHLEDLYDLDIIQSDGSYQLHSILEQDYNIVIAALNDDNANLVVCMLAARMGIAKTICILKQGYAFAHDLLFQSSNTQHHYTVDCINLACKSIQQHLGLPGCIDIINLPQTSCQIVGIPITAQSPMLSMTLKQINHHLGQSCRVLLLRRQHHNRPWHESEEIMPGDELIVSILDASQTHHLHLFQKMISPKNLMIFGASKLTQALLQSISHGIHTKVIDHPSDTTQKFSTLFDHVTVLEGDIQDSVLLEQENIEQMDAFFALSDDDEDNLVCALQAKKYGVPLVITSYHRPDFIRIIESTNIDVGISAQQCAIDEAFRYCHHSNFLATHTMHHNMGELVELIVPKSLHDQPLSTLNLPSAARLLLGFRDKSALLLQAHDLLHTHDLLLILFSDVASMEQFMLSIDYYL